jgi:hypothetical protein
MVKRAVEKFNKKVSALLPVSSKTLEKRDLLGTSSAFSSLKRPSTILRQKGSASMMSLLARHEWDSSHKGL